MKVKVLTMVQDPALRRIKRTEWFTLDGDSEACFLPGPTCERVAVLDFQPATGKLVKGAAYRPPPKPGAAGCYPVADEQAFESPAFYQTSVFGTVLKTIQMFEEEDVLGRRIQWAFDAPQLLVVPRAGEWPNAFYQRASHSLQFFFFPSARKPERTVHTCLSHDIVCHETGHALLDGICPDLYDAVTPQSRALHEAIADLTALVMAFRCKTLRSHVLRRTRGSIEDSTAFSTIAQEFGTERGRIGGPGYLRNLRNERKLSDVSPIDPYGLCTVLTGAIYSVAIRMHRVDKARVRRKRKCSEFSASGEALFWTHERLKRIFFRGLDYLPPGEIAFADYARAVIAADQASNPKHPSERKWIAAEFVERGIVKSADELQTRGNFEHAALKEMTEQDLADLLRSDWAAYDFVERNRRLLQIPRAVPFEVRPRQLVRRKYFKGRRQQEHELELLLKVSWEHEEANPIGNGFPERRRIRMGTTLAVDVRDRRVRALITTKPASQRSHRTRYLASLIEDDLLRLRSNTIPTTFSADVAGDCMRVHGATAMLQPEGRIC